MRLSEVDKMVDEYMDNLLTESAYQEYFQGMLKKYGVKSPMQLPPDKKKQFFADIKKGWAAQKGNK